MEGLDILLDRCHTDAFSVTAESTAEVKVIVESFIVTKVTLLTLNGGLRSMEVTEAQIRSCIASKDWLRMH